MQEEPKKMLVPEYDVDTTRVFFLHELLPAIRLCTRTDDLQKTNKGIDTINNSPSCFDLGFYVSSKY